MQPSLDCQIVCLAWLPLAAVLKWPYKTTWLRPHSDVSYFLNPSIDCVNRIIWDDPMILIKIVKVIDIIHVIVIVIFVYLGLVIVVSTLTTTPWISFLRFTICSLLWLWLCISDTITWSHTYSIYILIQKAWTTTLIHENVIFLLCLLWWEDSSWG